MRNRNDILVEIKKIFIRICTVAILAYLGLCAVFFAFQRAFIYFPTEVVKSNAQTITVEVPGASLRVAVYPREAPSALIYFGGNAENVVYSLHEFVEAFPDRAIYMPHYRGYSGSSGKPSEKALHRDAKAIFDVVRAKHSDIVVVGRSLGSAMAIRLASSESVSRLVLITPFDSVLDIAKEKFPYIPISLLLLDRFESRRFAPLVKASTLIIAASEDEIVPIESTRALFNRFSPGIAKMKVIEGADHNSVSLTEEYMSAIVAGE